MNFRTLNLKKNQIRKSKKHIFFFSKLSFDKKAIQKKSLLSKDSERRDLSKFIIIIYASKQ